MDSLGELVGLVWVSHQRQYAPRRSAVMSKGGGGWWIVSGVTWIWLRIRQALFPPGEFGGEGYSLEDEEGF